MILIYTKMFNFTLEIPTHRILRSFRSHGLLRLSSLLPCSYWVQWQLLSILLFVLQKQHRASPQVNINLKVRTDQRKCNDFSFPAGTALLRWNSTGLTIAGIG